MTGRVHATQSLGAVDGPGLRYVVFMQGCPLRCIYCHNPDTWAVQGGTETTAVELVEKIRRFQPYFGRDGGVTLSGGEPLLQAGFAAEFFTLLQKQGIHTALDTACCIAGEQAKKVLAHTDLVLADLKFADAGDYRKYTRGDLATVEQFLALTEEMEVPLWVRHVVVPGYNDNPADMRRIFQKAASYRNFQKLEWLPFHNMCIEKYDSLGMPFPLRQVPNMDRARLADLAAEAEK